MNAKQTLGAWSSLLLVASVMSCASQSPTAQVLYEQGRTLVQIEVDPTAVGIGYTGSNTLPIPIESEQLTQLLRGIRLRTEPGLLGSVLPVGAPSKPVFTEEDLTVLGPILAKGLTQTQPSERISFSIGNPRSGRTLATTAGFVSIRGPYLRFVLADHPLMALPLQENPSPIPVTLEFVKAQFLRPGTEPARRGDIRVNPVLEIDHQRYLSSLAAQSAKPAPPAAANESQASKVDPITELQQQVQELTRSNQELQAQLKELRQQLEQRQGKQQETRITNSEEVARLRQELAEAKQLLAETVLELNRLKSRSESSPKAKAPSPSER
jgi:hypothetical protein